MGSFLYHTLRGNGNYLSHVLLTQVVVPSVIYTEATLAALVATVGSERVLLGADYPFDRGEGDLIGLIARTRGLTRAVKEQL